MKEDQQKFLMQLGQPPARLTGEQTAWVLNCQPHDIPILLAARLLKPLGNPAVNSIRFFATSDVLELARDRSWLAKMTATIYAHWHDKNARQRSRAAARTQRGTTPATELGIASSNN